MLKTCRLSDRTQCTCVIQDGSPDVIVNGLKRARLSDPTLGHSDWINNKVETGSSTVITNNLPATRVTDWHTGHPRRKGGDFHKTQYDTGSSDHFTE